MALLIAICFNRCIPPSTLWRCLQCCHAPSQMTPYDKTDGRNPSTHLINCWRFSFGRTCCLRVRRKPGTCVYCHGAVDHASPRACFDNNMKQTLQVFPVHRIRRHKRSRYIRSISSKLDFSSTGDVDEESRHLPAQLTTACFLR